MRRAFLSLVLCAGLVTGCSDDDDKAASGTCPSVGGEWVVTGHCQVALIGSAVGVTQNGCSVITSGEFQGFQGTVGPNGELSIQGSVGGQSISCTGTATPNQVSQICDGSCPVTLERVTR